MLKLVKYQGLGNDFLIALDEGAIDAVTTEPFASTSLDAPDRLGELARAVCDRHVGVGADGLLVLRGADKGAEVRMELRNSDGGRAETSGNGLRCFALAVIEAGLVPGMELTVQTDAGIRHAVCRRRLGPGWADVSVEMGTVKVLRSNPVADAALPGSRALPWPSWSVDVGNPHLVLLAPSLKGLAITTIGPRLEKQRPGGQNVEFVSFEPTKSELSLVVWERGAGLTLACGSGSVAAAAALYAAGISSFRVRVHNPGGTAEVELSGDDPFTVRAELAGPVRRVATIEIDPCDISPSGSVVTTS